MNIKSNQFLSLISAKGSKSTASIKWVLTHPWLVNFRMYYRECFQTKTKTKTKIKTMNMTLRMFKRKTGFKIVLSVLPTCD